jgi:hypothetical protein
MEETIRFEKPAGFLETTNFLSSHNGSDAGMRKLLLMGIPVTVTASTTDNWVIAHTTRKKQDRILEAA